MQYKAEIWKDFDEDFVLQLLEVGFGNAGYSVTNWHSLDRAHEEGIDLTCEKENEQVAVQVKMKPKKTDVKQFARFKRNARGKKAIYVFVRNPTKEFSESVGHADAVEFWDAERLHAFLVENEVIDYYCLYFARHPLILSMVEAHELISDKRKTSYKQHRFSAAEISTLWVAKDNSVKTRISLYFVFQKWNTILMSKTEKDKRQFDVILEEIFHDLDLAYSISRTKFVSSFQELSEKHPDILGLLWELARQRTNWAEYASHVERSSSRTESRFFTLYRWICPLFNAPIKNRMRGFYSSMNYILENFKDVAKNIESALDWVFSEMNKCNP